MSYTLVIAEIRKGIFEDRNLDSLGFACLYKKDSYLVIPDGEYGIEQTLADKVVKATISAPEFSNPGNVAQILEQIMSTTGKPDYIVFTHSSSGAECAAYAAGRFGFPLLTDLCMFDPAQNRLYRGQYSDKVIGEYQFKKDPPYVVTVRSGCFKDSLAARSNPAEVMPLSGFTLKNDRTFVEHVEEEASEIDITKADFLLSLGRGVGKAEEIPKYEVLASKMKAILACTRPVIDANWLAKPRQVGTSGKTVKPKVYLAMGISGASQHIAGMKESDCIVAVNRDPRAPIFRYAHYGIVADMHKLRDKLIELLEAV